MNSRVQLLTASGKRPKSRQYDLKKGLMGDTLDFPVCQRDIDQGLYSLTS